MYVLRLTFPFTPKPLNKSLRTHYHARNRESKAWDGMIAVETIHKRPETPLPKAKLRLIRYSHRFLDFDGLVGSMKPVVDALVTCGILVDDSWKVTGPWEVDQVFRPQVKGQLFELMVEEIKNPDQFPNRG